MKHLHKLVFIYCIIVMQAAMISCKKDNTPKEDAVTSILENKKWKITSRVTYETTTSWSSDNFYLVDSCQRDDLYTFNQDRSLTIENGNIKCSAAEAQILAGSWSYDLEKKELTFNSNHMSESGTVANESENSFQMLDKYALFGYSYLKITVFTKQ